MERILNSVCVWDLELVDPGTRISFRRRISGNSEALPTIGGGFWDLEADLSPDRRLGAFCSVSRRTSSDGARRSDFWRIFTDFWGFFVFVDLFWRSVGVRSLFGYPFRDSLGFLLLEELTGSLFLQNSGDFVPILLNYVRTDLLPKQFIWKIRPWFRCYVCLWGFLS